MVGISNYLAQELGDHWLRDQAFTPPSTIYVALFTAAPTDAGGGTEVTGGSYARVSTDPATDWDAFSSTGQSANTNAIIFATATAGWGTVVAFGLYDAASGGNLLAWNSLTVSEVVNNGNTARFAVGALTVDQNPS